MKQEVDEELDDFPIILDKGETGENSIKSKLDNINKQMHSYNLKEKTAHIDQKEDDKFI